MLDLKVACLDSEPPSGTPAGDVLPARQREKSAITVPGAESKSSPINRLDTFMVGSLSGGRVQSSRHNSLAAVACPLGARLRQNWLRKSVSTFLSRARVLDTGTPEGY